MPSLPTPWLDGITPASISPSYCASATVDGVVIARNPYVEGAAQLNVRNISPPTFKTMSLANPFTHRGMFDSLLLLPGL